MSGAGEVVALAEAAVDLPKLGLVAQALVAAALSSPAAHLLPLRLSAGAQVDAAGVALLALAAGAQVARLAVTRPTVIGSCRDTEDSSAGPQSEMLIKQLDRVSDDGADQ